MGSNEIIGVQESSVSRRMRDTDVLMHIRNVVKKFGDLSKSAGVRGAARALAVSPIHLEYVLDGVCLPGDDLLAAVGLFPELPRTAATPVVGRVYTVREPLSGRESGLRDRQL